MLKERGNCWRIFHASRTHVPNSQKFSASGGNILESERLWISHSHKSFLFVIRLGLHNIPAFSPRLKTKSDICSSSWSHTVPCFPYWYKQQFSFLCDFKRDFKFVTSNNFPFCVISSRLRHDVFFVILNNSAQFWHFPTATHMIWYS